MIVMTTVRIRKIEKIVGTRKKDNPRPQSSLSFFLIDKY